MTGSDTKNCFVTIGATASFASLIKAVLARDVCQTLKDLGYDRLLIQYGHDGQELFDTCLQNLKQHERESLIIEGFDLDQSGLAAHMRDAKGSNGKEGVVISHAGSGTILDALRIAVPLVVVPNEELLDNHQIELAEALAEQGYVVHGRLTKLPAAILAAEDLRIRQQSWPPPISGPAPKGLRNVIDEELGCLD